jgi:uncharacterized protein (DUF305 family)
MSALLVGLGVLGADRSLLGQATGVAAPQGSAYPGRYPFTEADVHFVTGMISHHAQAIVIAGWAATHDAGPSIRRLCERIINAQTDEITLMQDWLRDRDQPVPEAKPLPVKMRMGSVEHEMMMPGMLTDDQMRQLDRARGAEFDRLFLTFMIQHHEGAVTMVDQLMASPGAAQDEAVYKFASDIYADQTTEIERMQLMLATLPPR